MPRSTKGAALGARRIRITSCDSEGDEEDITVSLEREGEPRLQVCSEARGLDLPGFDSVVIVDLAARQSKPDLGRDFNHGRRSASSVSGSLNDLHGPVGRHADFYRPTGSKVAQSLKGPTAGKGDLVGDTQNALTIGQDARPHLVAVPVGDASLCHPSTLTSWGQ